MKNNNKNQDVSDKSVEEKPKKNKLVGPGLGLIALGLIYFIWYIMPFSIEYLQGKPLAIHNWGYSLIFLTVGLAWYQKSLLTRLIALIQSSLLPIIASGSVNSFIMVTLVLIILIIFGVVMVFEKRTSKPFLREKLKKRTWEWLNMHLLIISWILIMHIGFLFLVVRAPQEVGLLRISPEAGWLMNYTPEVHEISTWAFNISIIGWGIIALYEQFKMGYNFQNKPWPRWSFWGIFIAIGAGLIGLLIQALTYGFGYDNILQLLNSSV
ncbi:MAG: hypothetical protein ACFFCI_12950 [Promethearchaeota archaeon]